MHQQSHLIFLSFAFLQSEAAMATPVESAASASSIFKEKVEQIRRHLDELRVIYGADACAVIYGPNNGAPQVWPPSAVDFRRVMAKFFGVPPEAAGASRLVSKISLRFLKAKIKRTREELERALRENRRRELTLALYESMEGDGDMTSLSATDLADMVDLIDEQTRKIEELILNNSPVGHPAVDDDVDVEEHQVESSEQTDDDNKYDDEV
uniref:Uncharacterized protein n=1 Tax=Kalanchoe fedtschenkoi TaxID=63787 RepID=A0A7N0VFG2_KALFE